MRTLFQTAFLLIMALGLSHCSSLSSPPPDVNLVDVRFGEVRLFETTLAIDTRVRNLGAETLTITGMVHDVSLNGISIGKAVSDEEFSLRPRESRIVTSTVEVSHLNLAFNLQELIEASSLEYELESEFFTSGLLNSTIRSHKEGTLISSPRIPSRSAAL